MVTMVSGLSLLGLFIVPFINGNSCIGQKIYKHVMTLLIAMGASGLLCDALFELFPTVSLQTCTHRHTHTHTHTHTQRHTKSLSLSHAARYFILMKMLLLTNGIKFGNLVL